MGIEDLKRWHWAVLGVALGLGIAYVLIGIGVEQLIAGSRAATVAPVDFENYLGEPPVLDYPRVRKVRVYPNGELTLVSFEHLVELPAGDPRRAARHFAPDDHRAWEYRACVLNNRPPYQPQTDLSQTVNVIAHPDTQSVYVNSSGKMLGAEFSGWAGDEKEWRDPAAGATVTLRLRRADYQLNVTVPQTLTDQDAADLSARCNGRPLPAFVRAAGKVLRTTVSAGDFVNGDRVSIELSRKGRAIPVKQLQLLDTHYTVLDYLAAAKTKRPGIAYTYGWWTDRRAMYAIGGVGGLVVIGGIWPTVLNLLLGAGFGRQKKPAEEYDLDRFKGETAPTNAAVVASGEELEAQLDARLQELQSDMAGVKSNGEAGKPKEAAVKKLDSQPVEAEVVKSVEKAKEFTGEFYPVARGPLEKK
jgi:hypothetical protein